MATTPTAMTHFRAFQDAGQPVISVSNPDTLSIVSSGVYERNRPLIPCYALCKQLEGCNPNHRGVV